MSIYESIRNKALLSVIEPDEGYFIRKVYRWYSKTFHTTLQDAYDLPLEEVLVHFYEERFEAMEENERQDEVAQIIETPEQRTERLLNEDYEKMSEFHLMEMSKKTNEKALADKEKQIKSISKLKAKPVTNKLPESFKRLANTINKAGESLKQEMSEDPVELPPEIDFKFESEEEFERLLQSDSNINSNKE